ncbi:hypothetical protein HDU96_004737, partial [Phlyctochytrium bullatum]
TLASVNRAEQATEELLCNHLVTALRDAGKTFPVWSTSKCEELGKLTTVDELRDAMNDALAVYVSTTRVKTIEAHSVTIDKRGKNGSGKERNGKTPQPDATLIAKAKPNSVLTTGFHYSQLRQMQRSKRMEICKDLTCNRCNVKGHISLDCPQLAKTKPVAKSQTDYQGQIQALLTKVDQLTTQVTELKSARLVEIEEPSEVKRKLDTSSLPSKRPRLSANLTLLSDRIQALSVHPHPALDSGVSQWIFDTGLTDFALTPFAEDLQDPVPFHADIDGAFAGQRSTRMGVVRGITNLGHPLQFVALHVPGLRARLVSRTILKGNGTFFREDSAGTFLVRPPDGDIAELVEAPNGLLVLSLSPSGPRPPLDYPRNGVILDPTDFSAFHADGQFNLAKLTQAERELAILHEALGHPSRRTLKRVLHQSK